MPEKITAYRCKYRCGQRVNTKKESILLHEKICFLNRERKACRTCEHWYLESGDQTITGWSCWIGHLEKDQIGTYNCKHWSSQDNKG